MRFSPLLVLVAVMFFAPACGNRSAIATDAAGPADGSLLADGNPNLPDAHADLGPGGCVSNKDCGQSQYCRIDGACQVTGAKLGQCIKRPEGCYMIAAPVCGCDGKTHGNDCMAHAAGVNIAHKGACSVVVIILTDKKSYPKNAPVKGTVINKSSASIFLQGCSIFSWEKRVGSVWIDKGPSIMCGWEGNAREVKPGSSQVESQNGHGPGTWRLTAPYGVGCTSGKPLSAANCNEMAKAYSDPFTVGTILEICIDLQSEYATALFAARKCKSDLTTPQCTKKVLDSLACNCATFVQDDKKLQSIQKQYQGLGCHQLPGIPVCPPGGCPAMSGAACIKDTCKALTM